MTNNNADLVQPESDYIGLLLRYPEDTLLASADLFTGASFVDPFHKMVWKIVRSRIDSGKPVSVRMLRKEHEALRDKGDRLRLLHDNGPSSMALVLHYVNVFIQCLQRRRLLQVAELIQDRLGVDEPMAVADEVVNILTESAAPDGDRDAKKWKSARDVMLASVAEMEGRLTSGRSIIGYQTGIPQLDEMLSGLQTGKVYVIAGRPASGKSILGLQFPLFAAQNDDIAVGMFSLEMPDTEVGGRLIAQKTGVSTQKMPTKVEIAQVMQAAQELAGVKFFVRDYPIVTKSSLRVEIRKAVLTKGCKIIVLDYLQMCSMDGGASERRLEIGAITKILKQLAKLHNIAIIILSQLNREADGKSNLLPSMLADSDEIGRDADVIIGVNTDKILQVMKQRGGPTGFVPVAFDGRHFRFCPLSDVDYAKALTAIHGAA